MGKLGVAPDCPATDAARLNETPCPSLTVKFVLPEIVAFGTSVRPLTMPFVAVHVRVEADALHTDGGPEIVAGVVLPRPVMLNAVAPAYCNCNACG